MNPICQNEVLDSDDLFDRLPDEIVLSVFNKLNDAKSLCLSMAVCRRFHSIAPQVDKIFLQVPRKKAGAKEFNQQIQKGFFKNLVTKTLIKPLHFISQIFTSKSNSDEIDDADLQPFYVPNDALKSFDEMRALHLRLTCYTKNQNLGSKKGNDSQCATFLKWKAEFGKELQSCVMLGAKSVTEKIENEEKLPESRVMREDEMKLRIVWTISCLMAASARHYLIQETVRTRKMIENVVVSDESEQGRVCMNKEQIEEMNGFKGKGNELECRNKIPALQMKIWYLERLELPDSGKVMEGATLVVIRPVGGGCDGGGVEEVKRRSEADLVAGAFGEEEGGKVLEEALRKLMVAKKCYTLEMNSF